MALSTKQERATILISVLWVIIIMSIVVLALNFEARSDVERTILMRDRAKAYWLARGATEFAKYEYAVQKANQFDSETEPERHFQFEYDEGQAQVILESVSAKMSINVTNEELWLELLKYYGLEEMQGQEVVDAIMDWRDEDDELRLNGAEFEYYQSLSPPYMPRNGAFQSVDEIKLVRGITEEMFYGTRRGESGKYGLKDMLSASGPIINRFDINSAPKPLLVAILNIPDEEAEALIQARLEEPFQDLGRAGEMISLEAADKLNRFFMPYRGNQFKIRATGTIYDSPARYTVEDEVRYVGGSKLFINLSHKDFSLQHVDLSALSEEEEE
jgi:general secretion pathway protein K